MKKSYLLLKIYLLFFQIFSFLTFTVMNACFAVPLETGFLNASTAPFAEENLCQRILFLIFGNKMKLFGANQDSKIYDLLIRLFECPNTCLCFFCLILPNSSGKQMCLYHQDLTVIHLSKESGATLHQFLQKTSNSFFRSLRAQTIGVEFCSSTKTYIVKKFLMGRYPDEPSWQKR